MTDRFPAYGIQLCVDCARPHELAEWWAEALRWEVEVQDEDFIRRMIVEGQATEADTMTHRGRLVWVAGAAINPPPTPPLRETSHGSWSSPFPRPRR